VRGWSAEGGAGLLSGASRPEQPGHSGDDDRLDRPRGGVGEHELPVPHVLALQSDGEPLAPCIRQHQVSRPLGRVLGRALALPLAPPPPDVRREEHAPHVGLEPALLAHGSSTRSRAGGAATRLSRPVVRVAVSGPPNGASKRWLIHRRGAVRPGGGAWATDCCVEAVADPPPGPAGRSGATDRAPPRPRHPGARRADDRPTRSWSVVRRTRSRPPRCRGRRRRRGSATREGARAG
jgi:hypothetical protein